MTPLHLNECYNFFKEKTTLQAIHSYEFNDPECVVY
jgi:hypothetical protein